MSGTDVATVLRHPQGKKLSEALAEDAPRVKAQKGLINKRATLIKAPDSEAPDVGASMQPTSAQLDKINKFTRKSVKAEDVVAFSTLSCNDIPDRDDDQFSTKCVKDFAALDQPFSSVGKSYLVDHNHTVQSAVGRIFDVDTKKVGDALFLTNDVYVPNTEKNAGFLEDIDFGVNWAVSVGVMLGKSECSLSFCKASFSSWGYWCMNGHDKGMFYTEDAEEDSWGFPLPCDSRTAGSEKCMRMFEEPRDFYELSQVFLGAQYYAALEKQPEFASVLKAATSGVPTIGLSLKESDALPLRHMPRKVSEAMSKYAVKEEEDGTLTWKDEHSIVWVFDPSNPDEGVLSLGRSISNEEEDDGEGELAVDGTGDDDPSVESGSDSGEDGVAGDGGTGSEGDPGSAGGDEPLGGDEGEVVESASDDDEEAEEEEGDETEDSDDAKQAIIKAATQARLPSDLVLSLADAPGDGLDALLKACATRLKGIAKENEALTAKAELGDAYIASVRSDAVAWYVKAHQNGDGPVKTDVFEKLLDRCGDDVALIKELAEEQCETARARFPKQFARGTTRSVFPVDPAAKPEDLKIPEFGDGEAESDARVKRIHG